jgi:glycosyltransferase involved in cell wall biosynthesis
VTTVSLSLQAVLADRWNIGAEYIPNGAPAVQPAPPVEIAARWSLREDGYLLYVARLVPEKRLDLLLRAWRTVPGDLRLVIAGDSNERRFVRRCRGLADDRVLFVGSQHGGTLAELYSSAAMVVQPSVLEGMPLVMLEAAAYGKCIVASDIQPHTDTLGAGLITFPVDDAAALAARIIQLTGDDAFRRQLGREGQQWVGTHRRWDDVIRRTEEVLRCSAGEAT